MVINAGMHKKVSRSRRMGHFGLNGMEKYPSCYKSKIPGYFSRSFFIAWSTNAQFPSEWSAASLV